ncbi:MAG TPA: carboxypeptidase-like regulatory domain-containing protein, partial [Lacipirellulaceae bacterium]|nr:carboxypeptidase-like regulatory domain-containing protein [Lacipirellulaceae bacterium]
MRIVIACVSLLAFGVAVQSGLAAEKKKPSPTATGAIKLVPRSADGQPLTKNSDLLWRKVAADAANKYLWHDAKTDSWWEQATGFATSGKSTFSELEPGTYRVTVRDGHDARGAIGIGEPVVIDAQHQSVTAEVRLAVGATLHLTCVDAKTGRPIPPPYLDLRLAAGEVPPGWQFRSEPVAGEPGEFEFRHLLPGQYRLKATRAARNPIDRKYELSEGEITIQINGTRVINRELKFTNSDLTKEEIERGWPFEVFGRVTDRDGQPIKDVVVIAHSGFGSMFPTGATTSDAEGHYRLHFAEGGLTSASGIGPAIVSVSKPGMSEADLGRQGEFTLAYKQPKPDELAEWLSKKPLLLAHHPDELNFTLAHMGTLSVRIHRENKDDFSGI